MTPRLSESRWDLVVLKSREVVSRCILLGRGPLTPWRVEVQSRECEMSTMFADTLLIVFISVCTALLAEGEGGCSPHV